MATRFYKCAHCGNVVEKVVDNKVPVFCCGQKMEELVPNTVEASGEKHIPVVEVKDGVVTVTVGSVLHPMSEEHLISWVYLETDRGSQKKVLSASDSPVVKFALADEKPVAVYAWCNLHGLWKTEI